MRGVRGAGDLHVRLGVPQDGGPGEPTNQITASGHVTQCSSPIGQHLGMCMDGFMFGSCCVHDTQDNLVQDPGHTTSKVSSSRDFIIPLAFC